METTMFEIEEWWRHNGCWDRQRASHIPYIDGCELSRFLEVTDEWWDSLTDKQKREVYEEFFGED